MEQYNALRAGPKAGAPLQQATLDVDQLQQLRDKAGQSCVYFLAEADLDRLALVAGAGLVAMRGRKDRRRQLSYYFGKHPGVKGLHAVYKHAGLVERGLRDLLHSKDLVPGTICLIGLSDELFKALGQRALPATALPPPPEVMPGYDDTALYELLDQHSAFPVPAARRAQFANIARHFIGTSVCIERVRRFVWLAAQSRHPILIQGESGTGKEVVARQIRECSPHPYKSFISVNSGAIPTELFESELFGCVDGAATNVVAREGMVGAAQGGVLFLDEIGSLLPPHQAKILRLLENGEYNKVGSNRVLSSNARIIAATHCDLVSLVKQGRFREDLYYRLFTIRIRTPSLCEHPEDIPQLAQFFWEKINRVDGRTVGPLAPEITDLLASYSWPGNARELRATLVNFAVVASGDPVTMKEAEAVMTARRGLAPRHSSQLFAGTMQADG